MGYAPTSPENIVTTKGDLEVGTGAGTVVRQAVGANNTVLTADSTQASGVKWAVPSSGAAPNVVTKTAAYTAANNDVVLASASGGAFTVTLPAATLNTEIIVKKTDATASAVTVSPTAGTIDGAASVVLNVQYEARAFISDGTNWFLV